MGVPDRYHARCSSPSHHLSVHPLPSNRRSTTSRLDPRLIAKGCMRSIVHEIHQRTPLTLLTRFPFSNSHPLIPTQLTTLTTPSPRLAMIPATQSTPSTSKR